MRTKEEILFEAWKDPQSKDVVYTAMETYAKDKAREAVEVLSDKQKEMGISDYQLGQKFAYNKSIQIIKEVFGL